MKFRKNVIVIIGCLLIFILGFQSVDAQQDIAQEAYAVFEQSCLICHGESGAHKDSLLIERTALVNTKVVIPGNPENSEFYKRLLGPTENGPQMPLNLPQLSEEAIETIARWITEGAPDWDVQHDINFITTDTMLDTIQTHLESLDPFDRSSARYFTTTHLYNSGESPQTLSDYRIALSKLINSLSWKFEITNPTPIDTAETIFYIDLRRYAWNTRTDAWAKIEQAYPYNIAFDPETQAGLLEKLTHLQTETASTVPFVHVDWFLATASLPPLYHDILDLPQTDLLLEKQLEVNVESNIRNAPGIDVWRAGFNDSGVSTNNRVVERHTSRDGAYWKSYDFAGSTGSQNIFTHPLDFTHDGGEIIFNLPNGLQAYYLVDAEGNRLDDAPIDIVSNPAASDPTVRNGLSCIGCHSHGMKTFTDSVRAAIEQDQNPPYNKAQALRLYPEQLVLDDLLQKDTDRFLQALEKIGGPFEDEESRQRFFKKHENEPIQRLHEAFQAPLDASHAAAAIGLETAEFLTQIREKQSLKNLGLQTLTDENGTVKRDAWTSAFDDVISGINSPDTVLPPVEQRPERIPGAGVHIPDPNLRAVIAEALGKEDMTAPITLAEITSLTTLIASNKDIKDLTGIEYATNLTKLSINHNPISDLSPLTRLTKMREVYFRFTQVSDLSPLATLFDLEVIGASETHISSLAPLAGLTKLKKLDTVHADITDLSPLAGLTDLTRLRLYDCKAIDISPLKGLTKLTWLGLTQTKSIMDFSPLAGLTNLKHLDLFNTKISDLSPLSRLMNLETLILDHNEIVDVTPLTSLHNLKKLQLDSNNILDFSPLDDIRKHLEEFSWYSNPGFPQGGPKIEGPWQWLMLPVKGDGNGLRVDYLAEASDGEITEQKIATIGALEGDVVGNSVWSMGTLEPYNLSNLEDNQDNLRRSLDPQDAIELVKNESELVVYGSIAVYSPRAQDTRIFVGASVGRKVWLNGELVHESNFYDPWNHDYQEFVPVTLKKGNNVLLVAGEYWESLWAFFFGFEPDTEYAVLTPGVGFTLSVTETNLIAGDTFTLNLNAENISDLAGWQADIAFDPNVLEAVEVTEGDFLKSEGGDTFFQGGTIDNTVGKITGLFSARISESGVSGTGTLLSVTFKAKAGGETQVTLENFEFISITDDIISTVPPNISITVGDYPAWDVNQDGQVSIQDLILVARDFGSGAPANLRTDVNRDGVINIQDLILVARHFGESVDSTAAPAILVNDSEELTPAIVQAWIKQAQVEDDGTLAFRQGIENLQRLLTSLLPEKTALLANYPNPFNPETWIPYHLAKSAEVTLTIYAMDGVVVRTLVLGHQAAGIYQNRSRAAYWDGRNSVGESVASGIYFYTLTAEDFTATRKMLILK